MAVSILWACVLWALASRAAGIGMPNHVFAPYGATFDDTVDFTGPAVFSGFVNFTGGTEGAGGGALPDTWTSSIDLTGAKTFSVTPAVAGTMTNVGIDTCIVGASTPAAGTFTSLTCDVFTAVTNVLDATSSAGLFDSIYFGVGSTGLVFEGTVDNTFEMYITANNPTAIRSVVVPDADGTVCVSGGTGLTLDTLGDMSVDASQPQVTELGTVTVGTWSSNITGATIDNSVIGGTTPEAGTFTKVTITGALFMELEGATDDAFELTLSVTDPTADRTITFPDATGTLPLIQPGATDTLDLSVGAATRTDIFAVGTGLYVQGTATTSSVVARVFLFGSGSYVEALEPGQTISDAVIMGTGSYVFMPSWGGGQLGDITNPTIIATGSSIHMLQSTGTMQQPGIFGGGGHAITHLGTGISRSDYNSIFGGTTGTITTENGATGSMFQVTLVGGELNKATITSSGNVKWALVGGGLNNEIKSSSSGSNWNSAIIAGQGNIVDATLGATVSGFIAGAVASGIFRSQWAAVVGGNNNKIGLATPGKYAVIVGGNGNTADHEGAVVMGNAGASDLAYSLSVQGSVFASGYITYISDERIKRNIVDLGNTRALDLVMLLQPRNYTYHTAFAHLKALSNTTYQAGFIAQEVEAIIPGAVTTGDRNVTYHSAQQIPAVYNDTTGEVITPAYYPPEDVSLTFENKKSLEYIRLLPYAIGAIQQLKTNADGGAFTTLSATTSLSLADGVDVAMGSTAGTKFGTSATQKLAFYGAAPVMQPSASGSTAGYSIGSGTAINDDTCSTGGTGTTCLTLADVVKILKDVGLVAL